MNRRFLLGLIGLSPLTLLASKAPTFDNPLVDILIKRWKKSKEYTLAVLDAMPEDNLEYSPSQEQMSFAQHFMHLGYTNNVFIGIMMDSKTYPDFNDLMEAEFFLERPDPINLFQPDHLEERDSTTNKKIVSDYVISTFDYVISSLGKINDESLARAENKEKPWFLEGHTNLDLILRGESHTAHHRAQAISYLRMNGIRPPGYSKLNTL
ncbi:putative damage-inducible protein DinB [Saonia flava]|uniref:Putative damage-inducible protein DinB n=1 Tax=Saonia flava TaxID=523696 RepID=A0A846QWY0_9FLAO|nr:DinB family protein [Saonia flava]NJB72468.1 putative damage-inducible protein DinB [Saonia flava]